MKKSVLFGAMGFPAWMLRWTINKGPYDDWQQTLSSVCCFSGQSWAHQVPRKCLGTNVLPSGTNVLPSLSTTILWWRQRQFDKWKYIPFSHWFHTFTVEASNLVTYMITVALLMVKYMNEILVSCHWLQRVGDGPLVLPCCLDHCSFVVHCCCPSVAILIKFQ
jgi:hypothetical protein